MANQQQSLNQLLQWGIENSDASRSDETPTTAPRDASKGLNQEMLAQLLGGPSDADLMRESMKAIVSPLAQVSLEEKMIAWDNFEQLIEQIDNANNMESLGLWQPLVEQLDHDESEMRRMAAWCCSTAVQNNIKSQERLLANGAIPKLSNLAQGDPVQAVRKKACSAISSAVRNFQPALDELEKTVPAARGADAADMDAVDAIISKLRESMVAS